MSESGPTLATEAPPIHPTSEAAMKLRSYYAKRIDHLRDELETPGIGIAMTDILRGQIMEARRLIRLITPEPAVEGTSSTY